MKIVRHTARDMRQALRGVREQLGEDAVILSSRRTSEGVEVTAAVDFDASSLEADGFANTVSPPPQLAAPAHPSRASGSSRGEQRALPAPKVAASSPQRSQAATPRVAAPPTPATRHSHAAAAHITATPTAQYAGQSAHSEPAQYGTPTHAPIAPHAGQDSFSEQSHSASPSYAVPPVHAAAPASAAPTHYATSASYADLAADTVQLSHAAAGTTVSAPVLEFRAPSFANPAERHFAYEPELISAAAREAVVEHALQTSTSVGAAISPVSQRAPDRTGGPARQQNPISASATVPSHAGLSPQAPRPTHAPASIHAHATAPTAPAPRPVLTAPPTLETPPAPTLSAAPGFAAPASPTEVPVFRSEDPVEQAYASALVPFGPLEDHESSTPFTTTAALATTAQNASSSTEAQSVTDAMGNELKSLRRMLETQLAQLAWNDLTRRAPIHTEILRELTEIGITPDLADHLIRQLPDDTDLTFARRFAIAGLSQYLQVTGDRWLDNGGRVAFIGATGVGKTTTLAKFAVRWVLRHGPRDIALVAADPVRIGAQDQLQSLAQLLGVPVYTPDKFDHLPALLDGLNERLVLIDTPGSSIRDAQAISRLAVLASSASKLETALVLAASTQAGALEEAVKRFAPTNPSCCVLTKVDEAVSLGGALSVLIRARLPISYVSEGQRVPEDLRPARALELVSSAVRLAKASGAAADEDLLRRRYGKTAHALT